MELQKQMDAAKAKKEEEARKRKIEEEREEARLKKERDELEQQFKREEESKKKKLDDVRQANADLMNQKVKEPPAVKAKKAARDRDFVAVVSKEDLMRIDDSARKETPGNFGGPPPPGAQNLGFQPA